MKRYIKLLLIINICALVSCEKDDEVLVQGVAIDLGLSVKWASCNVGADSPEDYGDYFGDRTFCDETMSRPYDYDFDQTTEFAYPAPFLAGDCRQIEFISSGNLITVPSSYVTRILVRMEGIYEK